MNFAKLYPAKLEISGVNRLFIRVIVAVAVVFCSNAVGAPVVTTQKPAQKFALTAESEKFW